MEVELRRRIVTEKRIVSRMTLLAAKLLTRVQTTPWTEVNISSYPATDVARSFFFRRAEILNSGSFVQNYSDQGVSCKSICQ